GHDKLRAFGDAFRPALHDGFLPGVKAHPFFSIRMHIAIQALFPAAKAVPGHWHRQRHINSHHADLNAARELAGYMTVARKAGYAIAERVGIDPFYGLLKVRHPHAAQYRPEDFLLVNTHLRSQTVE